jgi:hypothetical protein
MPAHVPRQVRPAGPLGPLVHRRGGRRSRRPAGLWTTNETSTAMTTKRYGSTGVDQWLLGGTVQTPAATSSRQPARRRARSGSASRARSASRSWRYRPAAAAASPRARAGVNHGPRMASFRGLLMASFIGCPLGSGGLTTCLTEPGTRIVEAKQRGIRPLGEPFTCHGGCQGDDSGPPLTNSSDWPPGRPTPVPCRRAAAPSTARRCGSREDAAGEPSPVRLMSRVLDLGRPPAGSPRPRPTGVAHRADGRSVDRPEARALRDTWRMQDRAADVDLTTLGFRTRRPDGSAATSSVEAG